MSEVLKVRFDCHGRHAPAYGCDRPNDNSGVYVQATDYDELEAERDALKAKLNKIKQVSDFPAKTKEMADYNSLIWSILGGGSDE